MKTIRFVCYAWVVSYRGTWIETHRLTPLARHNASYLIEVRGLKLQYRRLLDHHAGRSYLIEVRGLKLTNSHLLYKTTRVVSYRGTWIETNIEHQDIQYAKVVSYRGTWIETTRPK